MSHNSHGTEDDGLSDLRAKLQKDASRFLKGVTNNDVDWFLRGEAPSSSTNSSKGPSSSGPLPVNSKAKPTVASDGAQVLLKNDTPPGSATPSNIDLHHLTQKDNINQLHRSRTTDENDTRFPSYSLRKTNTNISTRSDVSPPAASRPRSVSVSSLKKASEPKKGFFKKLFLSNDSKEKSPPPSHVASPRLIPAHSPTLPSSSGLTQNIDEVIPPLDKDSSIDPKLEEYLKIYRRRQSHPVVSPPSSVLSQPISAPSTKPAKLDSAGNPIPPHPDNSPLPPAITNQLKDSLHVQASQESIRSAQSNSKFGLLKRHHSTFTKTSSLPQQPSTPNDDEDDYITHISASNVSNKAARIPPISILQKIEPLRKVAFAADVFVHDPPQQIPSRHPRKGNVEVLKDGSVRIHLLNEEEKKKLLTQGGGGVVVGGSGHLRVLSLEERLLVESQEQQDAVARAESNSEADLVNDSSKFLHKDEVKIDKPMVSRHKQYDENGHYIMDKPTVKLQLDELYIRCCHLREILPIPAIAKQIPKGTTSPLLILQLRNPRPSLIEVLAFSDFIRIAPIICISLDGVELSEQMFRIILSALVYKKHLEKLSLRKTPINALGWKLLCWFLSVNKRLRRLDLTQFSALKVNTQKLRDPSSKSSTLLQLLHQIERMKSNTEDRSDMDWSLLTLTLILRGGIEHIILSGCKIRELKVFKNLIEKAVSLMTIHLGLAYNDLTSEQIECVLNLLKSEHLQGLDIGYNDLSSGINYFSDFFDKNFSTSNLKFISLNSINLKCNENTQKLIPALSKLKNLKFLDLSNNKLIFPYINTTLIIYLPLFPDLSRIHLDSNDLDSKTIVTLAEAMTLCPRLNYISLLGNHLDAVACTALVNSLKISRTIFNLDVDYDEIPPEVKEKIGLYTMRNMEQVLYSTKNVKIDPNKKEPWITDSISQRMFELLRNNDLQKEKSTEVANFLREATRIRSQVTETISQLFKLQTKNQLTLEGKESLIRLCFLDSSLEKGLLLIGSRFSHVAHDVSKYTTAQLNSETGIESRNTPSDDDQDHSAEDVELKNDNISEEVSISKTPSSRSLKEMEKGEGSILKLNMLISHKDMEKIKDSIPFDDEEIRKVLLNPVDLNLVTEVLSQIKKQGISLEEVFKKNPSLSKDQAKAVPKSQELNLDNLRRKLKSLNLEKNDDTTSSSSSNSLTDQNTALNKRPVITTDDLESINSDADSSDTSSDISFVDDDDDDEENESPDHESAINQTYDSLLKDIVKVRTNNL